MAITGAPVLLRAEGLTRRVGDHILVDQITFDIYRGDVVAVVGPSGAGKSSLLRLLNRLDEPTAGSVYLDGADYRTIPSRRLRQRVGMVMQAPYLFPGTVADNVRFGPAQRGEQLAADAVAGLLDAVGLAGLAERSAGQLSGGEAQRVSLARTLANGCEILLLDEPTSALDGDARQEVEQLIRALIADQGLTALVVTHDVDQARRLAGRALLLAPGGRLQRDGPVAEVLPA